MRRPFSSHVVYDHFVFPGHGKLHSSQALAAGFYVEGAFVSILFALYFHFYQDYCRVVAAATFCW